MTYDTTEKQLNNVLREIKISAPYIEGLIILTWEGLTIASNLRSVSEEEIVAAICATLISLGENTSDAFKRGVFEYVFVRSKAKGVLLGKITNDAVLAMIVKASAKLGVLIYELNKAKTQIMEILR